MPYFGELYGLDSTCTPGIQHCVIHRSRFAILVCIASLCAALLHAQSADTPEPPAGEGSPLSLRDAAILGVVEGATEFLPVSSTGHLILANQLLDLERESHALDTHGQPLWAKKPSADGSQPGRALTVKAAADTYTVLIQVGAIAAVALLYRKRVLSLFAGLIGRDPVGLRMLRTLLVAFLPAAVAGLTLGDWITEHLFSPRTVAIGLAGGALLMVAVERWSRLRASTLRSQNADTAELDPADLSLKQALTIGCLQCVALWPGTSRSMMTIVGSMLCGLRPARAAEFSFLLGLVTLTAAAGYKGMKLGPQVLAAFGATPVALGCVVAGITAALTVHWLVGYLNKHGFLLFAAYRLALAAVIVVWLT